MLGRPTNGLEEIFERFAGCKLTFEWKYDGERALVSCDFAMKLDVQQRQQRLP